MDVTSETIGSLVKLAAPTIIEDGEWRYADRSLQRLDEPEWGVYQVSTLQGLVDILGVLAPQFKDPLMCVIHGPQGVGAFLGTYGHNRSRRQLVHVKGDEVERFAFGRFLEIEDFCIGLLSKFVFDGEVERLFDLVKSLTSSVVRQDEDTGIAQRAIVRTGVVTREDVVVTPFYTLRPFRTFPDVEQPPSRFLFRVQQVKDQPPRCALFEADGGAWVVQAKASIKAWLREQLGPPFAVVA